MKHSGSFKVIVNKGVDVRIAARKQPNCEEIQGVLSTDALKRAKHCIEYIVVNGGVKTYQTAV